MHTLQARIQGMTGIECLCSMPVMLINLSFPKKGRWSTFLGMKAFSAACEVDGKMRFTAAPLARSLSPYTLYLMEYSVHAILFIGLNRQLKLCAFSARLSVATQILIWTYKLKSTYWQRYSIVACGLPYPRIRISLFL